MPRGHARRSAVVGVAIGAGVAALFLVTGCSTPTVTPPQAPAVEKPIPADLSEFYSQEVEWRNCGSADCTTFEVPLDYQDPSGARVSLSMTRVRATGESIGSLFVNPGGPGGSAVEYAKAADYIVTAFSFCKKTIF